MYMNINKPKQALNYFKQALKIREQLGDSKGVRFEKNNIVSAYSKMGEIEKALDFYQQTTGVKGSGKIVGLINSFNCSIDAFELSRGTQKLSLYVGMPLYHADQLKVIKENCEIWVIEKNERTLVRKTNSPHIVEKTSPSGLDAILEIFTHLWKAQKSKRVSTEPK